MNTIMNGPSCLVSVDGGCISKENYRLAWFYASADVWKRCPFFCDVTQIYIPKLLIPKPAVSLVDPT